MVHKSEHEEILIGENFTDFLTRVDKIPLETKVEKASEYKCAHELAGVVYLLSNEFNIDPKLVLSDINNELERLKSLDSSPPIIESYLYNFAINKGKWIALFRGALYNSLIDDLESLKAKLSKLNKLKGSDLITLATQILMERQFIAANKLVPIFERWEEENPKANEFDLAKQIYASLTKREISIEIIKEFEEAKNELHKQVEVLGNILSEADQTNWIIRALIEAEMLYEDLCQPLEEMTSKALSDIIIWLLAIKHEQSKGNFATKLDMGNMITRFQLESAIGLSNATPQAKLEYNLLALNYKDNLVKPKLAEKIIFDAWKEFLITSQMIDIGR